MAVQYVRKREDEVGLVKHSVSTVLPVECVRIYLDLYSSRERMFFRNNPEGILKLEI